MNEFLLATASTIHLTLHLNSGSDPNFTGSVYMQNTTKPVMYSLPETYKYQIYRHE